VSGSKLLTEEHKHTGWHQAW